MCLKPSVAQCDDADRQYHNVIEQVGSINRMFTVMTDGARNTNTVVILVAHVSGPFCLGSNAATGAFSDIPKTSQPPR